MNSFERMTRRMNGESVDRPLNFDIFMTFAAHHIGKPLSEYYLDHRVLVDANLAVLEDFDLDIVQAISDPFRETADFGAEILFPEDDLPISKVPLLVEPEDIGILKPPDPHSGRRMSDRLEAIRLFREKVGGEVPIMGWVEGALAEAANLRGVSELLMDLILRPDWVQELLEICVEVAVPFALAQIDAGADIIGLGDAVVSQISPGMYRQFALPYEKMIFDAVHSYGGIARLHICGDTNKIIPEMVESGADIIDLDWMVDMEKAVVEFGDQVSFLGNFDPVAVMLQGSPDEVYNATTACLEMAGHRGFSAPGCEVPDATSHENLRAQSRALREFGD
ncbi:MAG: uroporphyrinogen decarboxylase [Anaerolineales bacterium]|nr:uroporphyrinogen decarboxylase [Anaerolineales bacterium]